MRTRRIARVRTSGREIVDPPAGGVAPVEKAVVETMRAALPEFDRTRDDAKAAPERRHGNLAVPKPVHHLLKLAFERLSRFDDAALRRHPRGDAALARSREKIARDIGERQLRRGALDLHLPLELAPVKQHRDIRI